MLDRMTIAQFMKKCKTTKEGPPKVLDSLRGLVLEDNQAGILDTEDPVIITCLMGSVDVVLCGMGVDLVYVKDGEVHVVLDEFDPSNAEFIDAFINALGNMRDVAWACWRFGGMFGADLWDYSKTKVSRANVVDFDPGAKICFNPEDIPEVCGYINNRFTVVSFEPYSTTDTGDGHDTDDGHKSTP